MIFGDLPLLSWILQILWSTICYPRMPRTASQSNPLQGGFIMLVLSRRPGEEIIIAGNIRVTVVSVKGDRVRVGIDAPDTVPVDRAEIHERRKEFHSEPIKVPAVAHDDEAVALGAVPARSTD